jgi:hypothetical protein
MKLIYQKHGSPNQHPLDVVDALGIKYEYYECNPISDQCIFHGVSKVPHDLPEYMEIKK